MIFNIRNLIIIIAFLLLIGGILLIVHFTSTQQISQDQDNVLNNGNWSIFRGNPQLTGFVDTKIGNKPTVKWTLPLDDAIISAPVIADGILYTAAQSGKIYAVSLETRSVLWEKTFEDGFESSPTLRNGFIYIGSLSGIFFKLNIADGAIVWKKDVGTRISGAANFLPNENKFVYFGCYDSHFYSLNTNDGEIAKKVKVKSYINGAPAANNNILAFGSCDGNLYLVNGVNSKEEAVYKYGNYIASSPVFFENSVTAATYNGIVKSFDITSNSLIWEWEAPSEEGFIASPATDGETIVLGNKDGSIYALDAKVGSFKWDFKTGDAVEASALIIGDKVFVGSTDGYFYILNLADGTEISSLALDGVPSSAAFYQDRFYLVTDIGTIYSIGE